MLGFCHMFPFGEKNSLLFIYITKIAEVTIHTILLTLQKIEVFVRKKCFSRGQRFLVQFGLQNALQKGLKSYQVPFLSNDWFLIY